jgi:alpha-N-arabinofuranosidase
MKAHSTAVAGLHNIPGGDDRFYNNIFVNHGFNGYDKAGLPSQMKGNVFLNKAQPSPFDESPLVRSDVDPDIKLVKKSDGLYLEVVFDKAMVEQTARPLVTTDLLGKAKIPDLPYLRPDATPYRLDTDYLGKPRSAATPTAGPFENPGTGPLSLKVW